MKKKILIATGITLSVLVLPLATLSASTTNYTDKTTSIESDAQEVKSYTITQELDGEVQETGEVIDIYNEDGSESVFEYSVEQDDNGVTTYSSSIDGVEQTYASAEEFEAALSETNTTIEIE